MPLKPDLVNKHITPYLFPTNPTPQDGMTKQCTAHLTTQFFVCPTHRMT